MELIEAIEIIEKIKELAFVIKTRTNDEVSSDALELIRDLCINALDTYTNVLGERDYENKKL